MPWSRGEFSAEHLAQDGDHVTPIQSDGTDVEHTGNSSVRSETDQIDSDAEEDRNPDGVQRCSREGGDDGPDRGEREEAITGEGEYGSGESLHCCEAHELDDDESEDSESNAT